MSDPTVPVREEDAFDVEAMAAWLRAHGDGVPDGVPEVRQFPGGASNLTYLLRYPGRDLILRRPPAGAKARGAHDMVREFTIQSGLAPVFSYVASMTGLCTDSDVIGSDFYVMERLEGIILRSDLPADLTLSERDAATLCTRFLDVLVELHAVDPAEAGLDTLGKGTGYVARQVGGWSARYRAARTDNVGDYERVMGWLDEHQPADVANCVIHNDFRLDNVVLGPEPGEPEPGDPEPGDPETGDPETGDPETGDPETGDPESGDPETDGRVPLRVSGVLDWEMATLGDPLMDLGGALAYWIRPDDDPEYLAIRRQPSHLPGMLSRAEMVDYYLSRTGREVSAEQWLFYEVFGLFRLGVIAQQIYYRYHHGQTTNEAYAAFLDVATYLERRCLRLIAEAG